eukprot:s3127_g5.t1
MALRHASGLEKLRAEFDHFQETEDWKIVRQKAGPVEHLLVTGLPRLGASHASLSGGQIHLAPALGQQLNVGSGIALVPGGLAAQAYRCCQILEQVLVACGSSLHQLVRLSCHVSHLTSFNSEVPVWLEPEQATMAARELRPASSSSAEALQPLEPFVLAPTEGQFTGDKKLRDRVTAVAIATAIYFIASALIQVLCGLLNERLLERNLRSLAQVQAVPELTWLVDALPSAVILSAVPILVVSFLTGCLFATCGLMGSKANSECCACCFCCCNACYCFCLVLAFVTTGAFLQSVSAASGTAELWFAQCDPKICYPLGFDTNVKTTIDCLAPAVWDEYTVQFEGVDHLPEECPPMYLDCDQDRLELCWFTATLDHDVVEERSLQEIDEARVQLPTS